MKTRLQLGLGKSIVFFPHLLWLLAIGLVLSSATQAQITVTSTADSGPGSLRQAIVDASSGNTIDITVTGTITLTTGQLVIDKDLTITGPGASQLTISGNNATRVFFINPGAAGATTGPPSGNLIVTIKELTIANGRATGGNGRNGGGAGGGAAGMGGALFINRGTVAVDHVSFTGNQAVGGTGGRGGYGTGGSGGGGGGFGGNGNRIEIGGEGGALGGSGGTYVYQANGGSGGDGAGGGGGGCCNGELGGSGGFGGGGGGGASSGTSTGGGGGFGGFGGGGGGGGGTDGDGGISAAGGTFGGTGGSQVGTYNDGGGGGGGGLGGAIFIRAGSITVTQSSFTGNQATPGVGGLAKNGTASGTAGQGKGGAIFILNAGATASISANTTYSNNTATDAGSVTTDNANTYGTFSTCAAFTATLTPSGQLTCANSTVTLMAGGGLAGATYQYSAGATNNGSTATVMADGPYSVTVTNPGGCSSTATTTVMSNTTVPTVSITPSMTAICAGQTATFTASGSPASYSWSSGQTTASISATAQGPYSVTATSTDNGCVATATATLTVNPLPTPSITNLNAAYCKDATAVPLTGTPPSGGVFTIDGTTATTFNPANLSTGQHTVVYSYTNANGCSNTASQMVTIKEVPQMPTITTRSGGPYPGGVSSLTISQNTGNVILGVSGCTGGTLTWSGGNSNTLAVSTANTGVQTFTATCTANGCTSPLATATVTVVAPTLRVFSRDPDNGQLGNNTIKPYLLLQNAGNTPINYSTITLRYWLTTENNIPLIFQKNYVQIGQNNVQLRYVPLATPRQGATGYIEYSFQPGAGSLAPMGDSGPLEVQANKQDYSVFDQRDDYSYVNNNSAYMLNPRITAYQNGVIFYGTEPGAGARRGVEETGKLTVQVLGNPVTGSTISVSVGGAEGQALRYELTDVSGHVVGERQVESAGAVEQQLLWVGHQPAGLFLLRVSTPTQNQTVKVLRQ